MKTYAYQGWISVFTSGTDYEADLVRDRLDDAGISAVVMTKRDHAFNLTVGEFSRVHVMVPLDQEGQAREILGAPPFTDAELEAAALAADPEAPDAHDRQRQSMLDTGADAIRLSAPDTEDTPDLNS